MKAIRSIFFIMMFCLASCKSDRTSSPLQGEALLAALEQCSEDEDWGTMLHLLRRSGTLTNQLFMNYANLALAHRGVLADSCFCYQPVGPAALLIGQAETRSAYLLQSDVYYTLGFIAASQRCAFEAMTVSASLEPDRACLKRLVKTNLIYGQREVARKYLNVLATLPEARPWVNRYRPMLDDDSLIDADPELGGKRRGLTGGKDRFSMFYGWEPELRDVISSNPADRTAIEYLGLSYLLQKDLERFGQLLDEFYGTEALPETLPIAFQQGVIALYQQHKERWADYHLSPSVVQRYNDYRDLYFQCQGMPSVRQQMARFRDTFWYYLMF